VRWRHQAHPRWATDCHAGNHAGRRGDGVRDKKNITVLTRMARLTKSTTATYPRAKT
jgi:hypothetical protein